MTHKGFKTDEDGDYVSVHVCGECGEEFTLCPAKEAEEEGWENCTGDHCSSYDPERDIEIVFMTDAEIARDKPIVSMKMLQKRKDYREGKPL